MIDFRNKKITVMGLGVHGGGVGVARFLVKAGAKVIVTDLKNAEELKGSIEALNGLSIKFVLGQHRSEDFSRADLVIKNPGVSNNAKPLQVARANKVPIETDIGIFFELCPVPIVGITGTRGKSTTSALIYEALKLHNKNTILAGNIRVSSLDMLPKIKNGGIAVLELSSWQLEGLDIHEKSPYVAVVTNIMKDHLNRYSNMNGYIEAKKNIFRFQDKKNYLVLNYDNDITRGFAGESRSKVFFYGMNEIDSGSLPDSRYNIGAWRKGDKLVFGRQAEEIISLSDIILKGEHNLYNVLAAITVAKISGVPVNLIARAVYAFTGLQGRLQHVRTLNNIAYINDTTSTTPDAVIAAVKSFSSGEINLILGGADKNLDYEELVNFLDGCTNVKNVILLPGTATDKFKKGLKANNFGPGTIDVQSMREAVEIAREKSRDGDAVLLSPGAASFGLFKNEFDRGAQFDAEVSALV